MRASIRRLLMAGPLSGSGVVTEPVLSANMNEPLPEISEDLKVKYFDIIYEFGLLTNTGHSPSESPGQPFRIPIHHKGPDGITSKCTCYGVDLLEACRRALEWLEPRGWKGHSQIMEEGLTNFAHGVKNMLEQGTKAGKIEVVE
jgi:hypothetical protein